MAKHSKGYYYTRSVVRGAFLGTSIVVLGVSYALVVDWFSHLVN